MVQTVTFLPACDLKGHCSVVLLAVELNQSLADIDSLPSWGGRVAPELAASKISGGICSAGSDVVRVLVEDAYEILTCLY